MKRKAKNNSSFLFIIGLIIILYLVLILFESHFFSTRFGFFTEIGGVEVSLKTRTEAEKILKAQTNIYLTKNVNIEGKKYPISSLIKNFDVERSVDTLFESQKNTFYGFGIFRPQRQNLIVNLSTNNLEPILLRGYNRLAKPPIDSSIDLNTFQVVSGQKGRRMMLAESWEKIRSDLTNLKGESGFVLAGLEPMISDQEVGELIGQARTATSTNILSTSVRGNFEIETTKIKNWLKITPQNPPSIVFEEKLVPAETSEFYFFNPEKVKQYTEEISQKINQQKTNAKLTMVNGQVRITSTEKNGYALDKFDTIEKIQNAALGQKTIALKVDIAPAEVRSDNLAELGIQELVSTGWSDFSGSPNNRIHNIRTGASKFIGALIKPSENFSFNHTLGPVEASTGYLPELVILEKKTTPQYGGGLCQVSSTAFRAALNAGFPILERTMHAYPVSYYRPYGVDATIYLPEPDLVFKNDSGHYILIQTRVEGTRLFFDFYGTKPARTIKFAGNIKGIGGVFPVEQVTPNISERGARGINSFTASVYRLIYDSSDKLIKTSSFISKYDSPAKFPH